MTLAPKQGLIEDVKDKFYEDLVSLFSKVREDELAMIAGNLKGHFSKNMSGYDEIPGVFGLGVRNLEGETIIEIRLALDITIHDIFFKELDTHNS